MSKKGVLLINLGTPDNCDPHSVRRYLKEFLNDLRVIDLPFLARWILVNLIILPFRYKKSAHAYQQIWTEHGSPLLINGQQLKKALAATLGDNYQVALGMRYANPSIAAAFAELKNCENISVIPLFPQYSSAATGSAIESFLKLIAQQWNIPEIKIYRDFYNHPGFISAYADVIKNAMINKKVDLLLFSYHGLPERHIHKSECQAVCNKIDACPSVSDTNRYCYRAQCYATSQLLAEELNLLPQQYAVSFQSRLGRTPWIKPYTDLQLPAFRQQGIKNIAIACPSFVADCLETLEEINMRAREQWQQLGGEARKKSHLNI